MMMKRSRGSWQRLNGIRHRIREWGRPGAPRLVLLHGWMDVSASWQFVVDALRGDWHVIAPDWRGFGASGRPAGHYWFADYYADLDALLDRYAGDAPVPLVGHSMGGNIACNYAGIRPRRVARLVSLEGFGSARHDPAEAPGRYARWLDELRTVASLRRYASYDELAERLARDHPRLDAGRARFLARHWGRADGQGGVELRADPRHRRLHPVLPRLAESLACWRRVTAPVLWVRGTIAGRQGHGLDTPEQWRERCAAFHDLRLETIEGAGHMLHFDEPQRVAALIEEFVAGDRGR
jgi:pimeloyl-ACP methyl ester carboxylesterase